ncbi:hypothetical protein [Candidatus Mycobacterium methanotrophicum]|uniref:Uncharacterized protein n=1 Tax=Candidatus Mycobacterium methanotrophicum TaxID=2943498 RepID=A0ABY4QRU1_9MYCO|nr:hypothetical protein [Candidatus Mycobacterium methanotrophicum]UQX13391.1 hypothetical protein M5I08_12300 [Candidatus Mycobacterium methanotrophicum]
MTGSPTFDLGLPGHRDGEYFPAVLVEGHELDLPEHRAQAADPGRADRR